jgi:hypothetical protein
MSGRWSARVRARAAVLVARSCVRLLTPHAAGVAVPLKDGDELSLGESTVMKVSFSAAAAAPAALTVDGFLRGQCDALVATLQSSLDADIVALRGEADAAMRELTAEAQAQAQAQAQE